MKFEIICDWKGTFKEFKYPLSVRYEFEGTPEELIAHIKKCFHSRSGLYTRKNRGIHRYN